jgi:uncharacterized protein YlxW (UPF0749 family)
VSPHHASHKRAWRVTTMVVFCVAGGLFITSGLNAHGLDLRAASVTDLDTVVRQERARTDGLQQQVASLNKQVSSLTKQVDDTGVEKLQRQIDTLRGPAGLDEVRGTGLTVTLNDAPKSEIQKVQASGIFPVSELVVHQQDIQAVVNALWAGGAEAMTVQDQRVVSTTGIKCVGNTVVLHGVPYAPPYRISAIGDQSTMLTSLDNSSYIDAYKTFIKDHKLGYDVSFGDELTFKAYEGTLDLQYAVSAKLPEQRRP